MSSPPSGISVTIVPGHSVSVDAQGRQAIVEPRRSFFRLGLRSSAGHFPRNVGACLRANAVTPFLKSSVRPLAAIACASCSIWVSRLSHVD